MKMTSPHSDVRQLIERAWNLRFSQKNADVETLLPLIDRALREWRCVPSETEPCQAAAWEYELLHVSVLRAQGQINGAGERIEALGAEIAKSGQKPPVQFHIQKALNLFAADEFSVALEYFLLADANATRPSERLICLMNILTCLENLNLPQSQVLTELESLLLRADESTLANLVRRQLQAYYQRRGFRAGDIDAVCAVPLAETMDQAQFHRLWISRLPYIQGQLQHEDAFLQKLVLSDSFHLKNYRLRTVLGDPRISEGSRTETPQQVDRIYLWTWNWLVDPSARNRENLAEALRELDFSSALRKMTFEDFQMLRNALSWIALFQSSLAPWIEKYMGHFTTQDCMPFPIFEYEWLCLSYVKARQSELETLESEIKSHPVHRNAEISIFELAQKWRAERERPCSASASLIIDEPAAQIRTKRQTLLSQPLVQVLKRLVETKTLSFADALYFGFGISPFDADIHMPKIYNLLARVKKLLPRNVTIMTKTMVIYWQGPTDRIEVIQAAPREQALFDEVFDFTQAAKLTAHRSFARPLHPRQVVKKANGKTRLTREELQELMHISKASTTRWIQKWQEQGLLQRQGQGRSTVYHIEIANHYRLTDLA